MSGVWDMSVGVCKQLLWVTKALQQEGQWLDPRGHFWVPKGCEEQQAQEQRAPGFGEEAVRRKERAVCQAPCQDVFPVCARLTLPTRNVAGVARTPFCRRGA